ncbi:MAG: hypothetical protein ACRD0A_09740 [Acidimicrobiales bacterium]
MAGAFFWGFVGASSLIIGGIVAMVFKIRPKLLGLVIAFGGGVLVSAVAYELVLDAFEMAGGTARVVALGLLAGALNFYPATSTSTGWVARTASGWRASPPRDRPSPSCSASSSTGSRSRSCSA